MPLSDRTDLPTEQCLLAIREDAAERAKAVFDAHHGSTNSRPGNDADYGTSWGSALQRTSTDTRNGAFTSNTVTSNIARIGRGGVHMKS